MSAYAGTTTREQPTSGRPAEYRYGAVLLLTLLAVVFVITASSGGWSRAAVLLIEGVALLVAVGTSRDRSEVRRRRVLVVGLGSAIAFVGVVIGLIPRDVTLVLTAAATAAVPVALGGGLIRLIRERGVTLQAVAGALAIYLAVGLVFAAIVGFVAVEGSGHYFAQGTNGNESDHAYFSFTVLTTTGFGDYSPATRLGRALAVLEMLTGQLYLVTVIGVLVGNFVGRRK